MWYLLSDLKAASLSLGWHCNVQLPLTFVLYARHLCTSALGVREIVTSSTHLRHCLLYRSLLLNVGTMQRYTEHTAPPPPCAISALVVPQCDGCSLAQTIAVGGKCNLTASLSTSLDATVAIMCAYCPYSLHLLCSLSLLHRCLPAHTAPATTVSVLRLVSPYHSSSNPDHTTLAQLHS